MGSVRGAGSWGSERPPGGKGARARGCPGEPQVPRGLGLRGKERYKSADSTSLPKSEGLLLKAHGLQENFETGPFALFSKESGKRAFL